MVWEGTEVILPQEPQSLNDGLKERSWWFGRKKSDAEGVDGGRISRRWR